MVSKLTQYGYVVIAVKKETKKRLERLKIIPRETMDSVINRVLDELEGKKQDE